MKKYRLEDIFYSLIYSVILFTDTRRNSNVFNVATFFSLCFYFLVLGILNFFMTSHISFLRNEMINTLGVAVLLWSIIFFVFKKGNLIMKAKVWKERRGNGIKDSTLYGLSILFATTSYLLFLVSIW